MTDEPNTSETDVESPAGEGPAEPAIPPSTAEASRPDPDDIEPLSPDEAAYQRDEQGDLIPQTRVVDTVEGWRTIDILPTPKGQSMEYQQRFGDRDELDVEDIDAILNEKIAEPDIDWSDPDIKPGVYIPVLDAILESIIGEAPSNQFHAEVREELDRRGEEGN